MNYGVSVETGLKKNTDNGEHLQYIRLYEGMLLGWDCETFGDRAKRNAPIFEKTYLFDEERFPKLNRLGTANILPYARCYVPDAKIVNRNFPDLAPKSVQEDILIDLVIRLFTEFGTIVVIPQTKSEGAFYFPFQFFSLEHANKMRIGNSQSVDDFLEEINSHWGL